MKHYTHLLLLPAAIFTGACTATHIYAPNAVNQPLLKKKNDLQVFVTHTDIQASYALTDHIGVMANGQYRFRNDFISWDKDLKGGSGEAGIGYFLHGKNKVFTAELYAGYGKGRFHTYEDSALFSSNHNFWDKNNSLTDRHIIGKFGKYFIQPGAGWDFGKLQIGTALRFSVLHYNTLYLSPETYQSNEKKRAVIMEYKDKNVVFPEASVTFRKGGKRMKFQAQFNFNISTAGDSIPTRSDFTQNATAYVGMVLNLGAIFRR